MLKRDLCALAVGIIDVLTHASMASNTENMTADRLAENQPPAAYDPGGYLTRHGLLKGFLINPLAACPNVTGFQHSFSGTYSSKRISNILLSLP